MRFERVQILDFWHAADHQDAHRWIKSWAGWARCAVAPDTHPSQLIRAFQRVQKRAMRLKQCDVMRVLERAKRTVAGGSAGAQTAEWDGLNLFARHAGSSRVSTAAAVRGDGFERVQILLRVSLVPHQRHPVKHDLNAFKCGRVSRLLALACVMETEPQEGMPCVI